ncbi:MAG: class I SAM-dependent methyltransferase [Bacteroidetes bacterium]|nr:class I SAM-dependent methyltransferase [Bacteroidota bacterium]
MNNSTPQPDIIVEALANIDIYLLDELLKKRINTSQKILDAGCGMGRNIMYLMKTGAVVHGVDVSKDDIEYLQKRGEEFGLKSSNFREEKIEDISFDDASFDYIICNAVLHFAEDETHFQQMLDALWRVLKPNGILFCRLASDIGIEEEVKKIEGRWFIMPDGSRRFLVNEKMLLAQTQRLGAILIEPLKTVYVHGQRCMTTWVMRK